MESSSKEARIISAISALRADENLSLRKAAELYNVPKSSLSERLHGKSSRTTTQANNTLLTPSEDKALVKYILDLDSKGFSPSLADVKDMADQLLKSRGVKPTGTRWPHRFVERHPELKARLNRAYDYQRALCEDPRIIKPWFSLVRNMKAKYGIADSDFYNFDETGFMVGVIRSRMVVTRSERQGKPKAVQSGNREWVTAICCIAGDGYTMPPFVVVQGRYHLANWFTQTDLPDDWVVATSPNGWTDNENGLAWLKHFDKHSKLRRKGAYRMLVLDGHESHVNAEFQAYCKEANIITLCLPPHSSHLTQPLDVGCFNVLKLRYGDELNLFIKGHITHITKVEFLIAFKSAFLATFKKENVLSSFRGSGLIPFDPDAVLSKLDVQLRTPSPPQSLPDLPETWTSQTPHTPAEALSQSDFIKNRIARHQSSSPSSIYSAINKLARGAQALAHEAVLLRAQVHTLQNANIALGKRKRAKKTRLQDGGAVSTSDAKKIIIEKGVVVEGSSGEDENGGSSKQKQTGVRHCSNCHKPGHNARTCVKVEDDEATIDLE